MNPASSKQHAIVIGGSITGLLTARILSNHFSQVTLIERDKFNDRPAARKSQPHAQHLHGLLAHGRDILDRYFPDLIESLKAGGAIATDMGKSYRWHILGDYRLQYESGMTGILCSRPFLEKQIRDRVVALHNVSVLDERKVEALLTDLDLSRFRESKVVGVKLRDVVHQENNMGQNLIADLVIDASGRHSASSRWLADLGYKNPAETSITVGVTYTTRIYRRRPNDLKNAETVIVSPNLPSNQTAGLAFPIEGDRWIVTLVGWAEQPPLDDAGFLAYAQGLAAPDVYDLIRHAEPLSEAVAYQYRSSLRRHYEQLKRFPSGYLVMGDAFCSFDPIYGQGMTAAALQAALLDRLLQQQVSPPQLAHQFFKQAARIIDIPWKMTVNEDFRFPSTQGKKPLGTDWVNAYTKQVQQATHSDPVVYGAFLQAMNLVAPPSSLFHPKILWRVFNANLAKKGTRPQALNQMTRFEQQSPIALQPEQR